MPFENRSGRVQLDAPRGPALAQGAVHERDASQSPSDDGHGWRTQPARWLAKLEAREASAADGLSNLLGIS